MGETKKKQIGFYAGADVAYALSSLPAGMKTAVINEAIREYLQLKGSKSNDFVKAGMAKNYLDKMNKGAAGW